MATYGAFAKAEKHSMKFCEKENIYIQKRRLLSAVMKSESYQSILARKRRSIEEQRGIVAKNLFLSPEHQQLRCVASVWEAFLCTNNNEEKKNRVVDIIDIVTPTLSHFECAKKAIE